MLKDDKERILEDLTNLMANLDDQIKKCDDDISETTKVKMVAQEQGDLSENIEYQTAIEKLGHLNERMVNLMNRRESWSEFSAIKRKNATEYVSEGSCILLEDREGMKQYKLLVVPPLLGASEIGAITTDSPVGRAALGKIVGDVFEIRTPRGEPKYTILEIY